jgi:hypothetical protein
MALVLRKAQGNRPGDWNDDDYDVMSNKMAVGRKYRRTGGPPDTPAWVWSILNVHAGPGIMISNGVVNTLDEAKAELAKNWRKWLAWAGLHDDPPA